MDTAAHQDTQNTNLDDSGVGTQDNVGASNKSVGIDKGKAPKHPKQQPEKQPGQQTLTKTTPEVTISPPKHPTSAALEQPAPEASKKTAPFAPTKETAPATEKVALAPSKATPPPQQQVINVKSPKASKAKDPPPSGGVKPSTILALHIGKGASQASSLVNPENIEGCVSVNTMRG
jgi:hypothetical protein